MNGKAGGEMDVRAADRDGTDTGKDFVRARRRGRHFLDLEVVGLEDDEGLHGRRHFGHRDFLPK